MNQLRMSIAIRAYEAALQTHPDLADKLHIMKKHFIGEDVEKPSGYCLYAGIKILTEKNYGDAAHAVSQGFQMHIIQAEKHVIDAVNTGPDFLKDDEEFLHAKGIMRGNTKYFLSSRDIKAGSLYDRAWHVMDNAYRPIIAAAIEGSLKKDKIIGARAMQYVAACLMPDELKVQELKGLSVKYNGEHQDLLREGLAFIGSKAKEYNIEIPEFMLTAASAASHAAEDKMPPSAGDAFTESTQIPKPSPLPAPKPDRGATEPDIANDFEEKSAPPPAPKESAVSKVTASAENEEDRNLRVLKRDLQTLRRAGDISEREMSIYLWLKGTHKDGEPRTLSDAVELLKKNVDGNTAKINRTYVMLMVANVNVRLRVLNADGHEDRALRPQ